MKLNSNLVLECEGITLVPYLKGHVLEYHRWMQNPELLEQTASEPLTLEQEYEMQKSWLNDDDKLTFIIHSATSDLKVDGLERFGGMIGDVNLFFNTDKLEAELEIMIADSTQRRRGLGLLASKAMMHFAHKMLGTKIFVVKIGIANEGSIRLFKGLGFKQESFSEIFQEVTMKRVGDPLNVSYEQTLLDN